MPETATEPGLKRELGLRDVTLFAIACIVGVRWVPTAAHAGPGTITLWMLAALLLAVPLAISVGALSAKYPGAGGLYQWTRADFGPWHGFLCFFIYWVGIAFWFPTAAMFYMSLAAYGLGPAYQHLADNRAFIVGVSLVAVWIALATNMIGMKIGKWTENAGAAATWIISIVFAILAAVVWMRRGPATRLDIVPALSWDTFSLGAATIAYAMTGMEMAAMMGAEIRDPVRTLRRAGWIASGFATFFYAGMTLALLILMPPAQIDERYGMAQASETAASLFHLAWLPAAIAILILFTGVGQFGGLGSSVSRLPFAAGADKLLPRAFSRIHPRWHTPHVSILVLGCVASFLLVVFQFGDTLRAAYDTLVSMMVIGGFLPYVYLFGSAWIAGKRVSAAAGWLVTAIALISSVVPSGQVTNVFLFELKLGGASAAMVVCAWLLYRRALRPG
jgi:glutamate:GABA antiporter